MAPLSRQYLVAKLEELALEEIAPKGVALGATMLEGTVLEGTVLEGTVLEGTELEGTVLDSLPPLISCPRLCPQTSMKAPPLPAAKYVTQSYTHMSMGCLPTSRWPKGLETDRRHPTLAFLIGFSRGFPHSNKWFGFSLVYPRYSKPSV
jgi:hypothetical protein